MTDAGPTSTAANRRGEWCNADLPGDCFRRTRVCRDWHCECDKCGLLAPTIEVLEHQWVKLS